MTTLQLRCGLAGLCLILVAHSVAAQDVPYTFELNNQVYQPLEEYSVLPLGLGWDDPEVALPLPFDMVMWGDTCEFVATANVGEMLFCAGANGNHFIAPMTADVCDLSVLDSTLQDVSELRHSLEGTAPDRVFKLEYHNLGFYNEVYADSVPDSLQRVNLQVWLHEQGTIAFHYGPNNVTDVTLVQDDLQATGGLFGNVDLNTYEGIIFAAEGEPNDPAFLAYGDFASWAFGAQGWGNAWPADGTQYIFNPVAVASVAGEPAANLDVFPNPANDVLHVVNPSAQVQHMAVVDLAGRTVASVQLTPGVNRLPSHDWAPGTYLLRDARGTHAVVQVAR